MKKSILISILYLIINQSFGQNSLPAKNVALVYSFSIKEEIAPPAWRVTQKSINEALSLKADYIVLHMNTYGGLVDAADSIRTKILNCPIPVYVFIDDNAASAGALIALACDKIYMRKGGKIGAATVVNATGEAMPDKYQAYMRATMRATAESHGKDTIIKGNDTIFKWKRDPLIAEAMVDPRTYIAGINDTGKVLTFTTSEAIKYGYCEGEAQSMEDLLEKAGISDYKIVEYKPTWIDLIIHFLLSPMVHGILIMIIVAGIYFELQTPGIGFPLIAAVTAAVFYFAPLYLEGLAANWEILVFVIGVILIIMEIFVIPGFGIAGISGIVLTVLGLTMAMVENFEFEWDAPQLDIIFSKFLLVIVSILFAGIGSILLGKKLLTSKSLPIALHDDQKVSDGYVGVDLKTINLTGKQGIAYTVLRPSGKVEIENNIYDAVAEAGFIDRGQMVIVTKTEAGQIIVRKI